jgi:hypothetical protein
MADWKSESIDNLLSSIYTDGRWVFELFSKYQLYSYIDPSKATLDKLNEQSLFKKLIPAFLHKAKLSKLLDALAHAITGLHLIGKVSDKTGLLEELYKIMEADQKLKQTLIDRIYKIRVDLEKRDLSFGAVKSKHSPTKSVLREKMFLRALYDRIDAVDQQFVAVAGTLCSIDAMRRLPGVQLPHSLQGSGCRWVICDFPPFVMANPKFEDAIVMLELDDKVLNQLEEALPFARDIGWYPYVRVYGHCRRIFSNKFLHPALKFSWMEYRLPQNPTMYVDQIVKAYEGPIGVRDAGFNVDRDKLAELILFVDVLRIMGRSVNYQPSQLSPKLQKAIADALQRLAKGSAQAKGQLPDPLPLTDS